MWYQIIILSPTCLDSRRRWAIIFRTFVTDLSTNPSPGIASIVVFLSLGIEALPKSVDFIEPNKPEPWEIDWN